jgi:hypothetical protein
VRTVLATVQVVSTERTGGRTGGEFVARAVDGEDVYTIRGAGWIRAGMRVRLIVERDPLEAAMEAK